MRRVLSKCLLYFLQNQYINDGKYLIEAFSQSDDIQSVLKVVSQVRGPWAEIYWQVGLLMRYYLNKTDVIELN